MLLAIIQLFVEPILDSIVIFTGMTQSYRLVYIDMGVEPNSDAMVMFTFDTGATGINTRTWDIKLTQVECGSFLE